MYPKVSIIVPIYKVEKYLRKCIDSILNQTMTEFELILINDGSPDRCGEICDVYAKKDTRIKVIHKKNGGLADARNAGLEIAEGDYVGFVDSDDWIEKDMYEILYNICVQHECDIASCSCTTHYSNKIKKSEGHPLTIHDTKKAMKTMLEGELYNEIVCNKLFKRNILNEIRFTIGLIHEDTDFTYKAIHKSMRVGYIGLPRYHYIKRENSIMDLTSKNIYLDAVLIYDNMYRFINKHYKELTKLVVYKLANSSMVVLNSMIYHSNFNFYRKDYYRVMKILNSYFNTTIKIEEYPLAVKVLLISAKIHPLLYRILINVRSIGDR